MNENSNNENAFSQALSQELISVKKLLESGAHFGHPVKRFEPKMKQYVYSILNGNHIINLNKTVSQLEKIYEKIRKLVSEGKKVLFVCTKPGYEAFIKDEALRSGSFYVTRRWLGGTLTNFPVIKKRAEYLKDLQIKLENNNFTDLSKKDLGDLQKEAVKLEANLGGIKEMRKIPDVLIVVDPKLNEIACIEASKLKIPVIGICDTNTDPVYVTDVIPANDESSKTVTLIVQLLADAIVDGRNGSDIKVAFHKDEVPEEIDLDKAFNNADYMDIKELKPIPRELKKKNRHVKRKATLVQLDEKGAEESEEQTAEAIADTAVEGE